MNFFFGLLIICWLESTVLSVTNYCEIEERLCGDLEHIGCEKNVIKRKNGVDNVEPLELSSDSKISITEKINNFRSLIATGKQDNSKKTVVNMQLVSWSDEMESLSKQYALQWPELNMCVATAIHLNQIYGMNHRSILESPIEDIINEFFDYLFKNSSFLNSSCFTSIGCSFGTYNSNFKTKTFIKCIGNQNGQKIVQHHQYGEPCSKCKENQVCSEKFIGLCEDDKITNGLSGKDILLDGVNDKDVHSGKQRISDDGPCACVSINIFTITFLPFWILLFFLSIGVITSLYFSFRSKQV